MGSSRRKYSCDDSFFDHINSELSAYWLGFLSADGYVRGNAVALCLSPRDREHIVAFARDINCNAPVRDRSYAGYSDRSEFRFTSKQMVCALRAHGVVARKSLILEWSRAVPANLLRHYLRGYMDGDGGFYLCQSKRYPQRAPFLSFSIAGTESFCCSARDYLTQAADVPWRRVGRRGNFWTLSYERKSATRVYDLLYDGATVYLARKKVSRVGPALTKVDAVRLKALRKERDLTQEQLCAVAGVSYQTVYRIESGWTRTGRGITQVHGCLPSTIRKLATALGVEPSELVKAG